MGSDFERMTFDNIRRTGLGNINNEQMRAQMLQHL